MRSKRAEWPLLPGAAMGARDELRQLAAELTAAMNTGSIPRALIVRARDIAVRHADSLRMALKHPAGAERPRRKFNRNHNLPCWIQRA
jgi:hypothetical protein